MNLRVSLVFCCLLIVASPAFAMFNASELPPVGDCGLPADGHVAHQITYTLTSDCPTDGDLYVTHGVTVTIDSNGFCFKIRIEDGQVIVIGKDGASATYTSGTISTCSSGHHMWTLPQDCFQRLGAIGIICRVPGPGPTIEVWEITPDSVGRLLLRVSQPKVDAARPDGLVASTPDGRVALRVRPDEHITISMGPSPGGKVHHVSLEFTLHGRVIGTVDTYGGPPGAPVSALPVVPQAPAALAPTDAPVVPAAPSISSSPRVSPIIFRQPAQEDGSLIHVVKPGQTLFSIARTYGVPIQDLIRRNRLEPGGAWLLSDQTLIIRDAPAPDDADDADAATVDECDNIIHVVQAGETIYSIAQAYDVHPRHLAIRNQIPYGGNRLHAGQQLVIPDVTSAQGDCAVAGVATHVVQPGHTLYSIALVYGVALDDLIRLNCLTNEGHTLYSGQELIIRYVSR